MLGAAMCAANGRAFNPSALFALHVLKAAKEGHSETVLALLESRR
jgi:hypothetical protein